MISLYYYTSPVTSLIFYVTFFLILLALSAYFSVFIVSSIALTAGETQAIMTVFVFPPNESLSNLVNLEFLYGTKIPFFLGLLKILIQFPRANKDLLILAPSTYLAPLFSHADALSLPAKSIIYSLECNI
jgi:hypothetical protein